MALPTTPSRAAAAPSGRYAAPLAFLVMLFFSWGFLTAINDILLPHLQNLFDLSFFQAGLVQFCFFGAYLIMGIPSGMLIEKLGNRRGIVLALIVMALGCFLFLPASRLISYPLFLGALFVLASGIVVLQTAANPFVALLGTEETAARRLNLSQAFNSLGHTMGPSVAAWFILRGTEGLDRAALADAVRVPYVFLGFALLLLSVVFAIVKLPSAASLATPESQPGSTGSVHSPLRHRNLVLGMLAIFLYVGSEVSIGSFLVKYFGTERLGALTEERAGYLVSFYWGAAMIGRFTGSAIMAYIAPNRLLAFNALAAIALLLLTMSTSGAVALWTVLAIGLFNSIMFPNIFTLAIAGLGEATSRASGLLVMSIFGGAILPMIQGQLADSSGIAVSFLVPVLGYAYVAYYGFEGYKPIRR